MKVKIGRYDRDKEELVISASLLVEGLYEIGKITINGSALYSLSQASKEWKDKHDETVESLSSSIEMLEEILRQYNPTYKILSTNPFYLRCVDVSYILEKLDVKNIKKLTLCGTPDLVLEVRSKEVKYKIPVEIKLESFLNKNKNKTIAQLQVYSFIFAADAFGLIFSPYEQSKPKEVIHISYSFKVQKTVEKLMIELIKRLKIPGAGFEPATSRFL